MTTQPAGSKVADHYGRPRLLDTILGALQRAGKDIDRMAPEDLAPIDEFHIRGRQATMELARAAGITAATRVLDVGCGLGGPARALAAAFGCHVTGIDLTPDYCAIAEDFAKRTGLGELVHVQQGDALALPFADGAFDVVWTQHAAMNIADKPRMYREMHRVLAGGGTVAIYDIVAGSGGPVHFPVPWATDAKDSHLATAAEMRSLLESAGFRVTHAIDSTDAGLAWFAAVAKRIQESGPPPIGLHLLMGDAFAAMAQNQKRNLEERRIETWQFVAVKA